MKRIIILAKQYWVVVLFCALIALPLPYFLLWFYFIQAVPKPTINYLEKINQVDAAIVDDERAWPIYREALRSRRSELALEQANPDWDSLFADPAGLDRDHEAWTAIGLTVDGFADVLGTVHQASSRAVLGLELQATYRNYAPDDRSFLFPYATMEPRDYGDADSDIPLRVRKSQANSLSSTVLPHTDVLRLIHWLLEVDLAIARDSLDSERVVKNLESGFGLARHKANKKLIVESLLAEHCFQHFLGVLEDIQNEGSIKFREEQKVRLKRAIERIDVFALFEPAVECYMNYDYVQRFYTDNGNDDGHLTNDWLLFLRLSDQENAGGTNLLPPPESTSDAIGEWVFRPFVIFAKPTRAQVMETLMQHEELLRQAWQPPYDRQKLQDACDQIKMAKLPAGMVNDYDYLVKVYDRLVLLEAKRRAILKKLSSSQPESKHEIDR